MKTLYNSLKFALLLILSAPLGSILAQPCATPNNVTATPMMVCVGGSANLNAVSTTNNINWYTQPVGGVLLGTVASGANFSVTPSATTTYYAEAVTGVTGTQTYNFTGSVQTFTVPPGVTSITIDAKGAQGGNTNGGKGARMIGTFTVTPGENIGIAVGQQGIVNNCGGGGASGGGGGGTFAWRVASSTQPLIAAGGGGGGNMNWSGLPCTFGLDAVTTVDGTQGSGSTSALGGTGGNGGFGNAPSGTGSGGGGWLSAGQNSTYGSGCTGGLGPFSFTGGSGASVFGPGGEGGFGGGGGAVCGCGGGGGYSGGGGGGGEGSQCRSGGGGGGSYNSGTSQNNTAGVQLGNGQVVITFIGAGCTASIRVPVTVTVDNVAPVAVCQPVTINLDPNGNGSTTAAAVDNGSTDNCAVASVSLSQTSFSCSDAGLNSLTLTVTDNNGNTGTCSAAATVVAPALLSSATTDTTSCGFNVSCPNGSDGIAQASATGGCPGYTYLWSNGATTAIATNLGQGTYTVTITDAAGGTVVNTVVLVAPPAMQTTALLEESCVGDATGGIDLTTTGGNTCAGGYSYLWSNGATTSAIANLAPGPISVTITDGLGCTLVQTITVPAYPSPMPTFTQAGNQLTASQSWTTYQWLMNGSAIPGANANTYTLTQTAAYSLQVTDTNGCSGISGISSIVGVAPTVGDWTDLSIYPNPARNEFRLKTMSPIGYAVTVNIHDLYGKHVFMQALPELGNEVAFDIKSFAAGTYLIEVTSEAGQRKVFRLVVE